MSTSEQEPSERRRAAARELAAEMVAVARVLLGPAPGVQGLGHVVARSDPSPAEAVVPAVLEVPPENDALVVVATDLSLQTHSTPVPVPLPARTSEPRAEAPPGPPEPVAIPVPGFGGRGRTTEMLEEIGFLDD